MHEAEQKLQKQPQVIIQPPDDYEQVKQDLAKLRNFNDNEKGTSIIGTLGGRNEEQHGVEGGEGGLENLQLEEGKARLPPHAEKLFFKEFKPSGGENMAKDGTNRGGARIGAGRKRKSLEERLLEGNEKPPETVSILQTSFEFPAPKPYLSIPQRDGAILATRPDRVLCRNNGTPHSSRKRTFACRADS